MACLAVDHALHLAREYRVVRPPWLHNVLVNYGYRERGLCFHWANDLFAELYSLNPTSLEIRLVVSGMDTRREHNAILVSAPNQPFEDGLILDPWRKSGRLWFGPVSQDRYQWTPLPPDRVDPKLQELFRK